MLDELEPGAPAEEEQRQDAAGHNDERRLYAGAGEQPKAHANNDGADPNGDTGSQREWVPPGAPEDRSNEAPGEKRPRCVRHAQ